jgi:poly(beta-D-mannuronate) lyase
MKKLIATAAILLFALANVGAKVYKVSNADDFKKAIMVILPGDTIEIANGNYSGWEMDLNTNGTPTQPVIIKGQEPGKVVFSGNINKPVFQLTGSFTEISNLAFSGCTVFKSGGANGVLIELKGSKFCRISHCNFSKNVAKAQSTPIVVVSGKGEHNRVDHCVFTGNIDNQEVQVKITANAVPLYSLVDYNEFRDKPKVTWKNSNGGECVQVGQDPIMLGTQEAFSVVRDNRFIHCDGEPEVISNKSSANKYINNQFEDCNGELVMRGGHDCLIDSNIFKGGSGGIRINGTHHTITNNRLEKLPTAIRLMYGMAKGKIETGFYIAASDCIIKNNRINNCTTGILIGDSKNADWTGKFDTTRYPSRTMQDIAPFNNTVTANIITNTKTAVLHNEN